MITIINWAWPVFLVFSIILLTLENRIKNLAKDKISLSEERLFSLLKKIELKFYLRSPDFLKNTILIARYATFLIFFNLSFISFNLMISGYDTISDSRSHISLASIIYSHLLTVLITILSFFIAILISKWKSILYFISILASAPIIVFFPVSYLLIYVEKNFFHKKTKTLPPKKLLKRELLNILASPMYADLETPKRKLLSSMAHFDEKMCREIMIPRIKIECLEDNSSIFESLSLFIEEGYSRIPIYEKSIDHVTGMLLYKDVLEYTFKTNLQDINETKKTPISSLISPILYAPENKHISDLFQVMRSRKIHAAIIVNEYGCTEGLVTIEDIFEELIGSEILDEHDDDDLIYKKTHDKGWIIDANVSIIDAEREFGIKLPHNAEYETVGGFISTTMGVIPQSGSVVHHEKYRLKVLSSNERQILKIKISEFSPSIGKSD